MYPLKFLYFVQEGLYALLFQSFSKLQQSDIINDVDAEEIFETVQEAVLLLDIYHSKETSIDDTIWNYEPSVVITILSKRRDCQSILIELSNAINSIQPSLSIKRKLELSITIVKQFKMLISAELLYMPLVAEAYSQILKNYYNRVELLKIQTHIMNTTGPWILNLFEKWTKIGISVKEAKERLQLLSTQKSIIIRRTINNNLQQKSEPSTVLI